MYLYKNNRTQWVLAGALSAGLALAPVWTGTANAQSSTTAQPTPAPGQQGNWGQAGPPPDVQNGQIPAQDQNQDQNQDPNQAAPQGEDQGPQQYPGQAPAQTQGQYPSQGPNGPAVGYGQGSRPAYQPQGGQYQGGQPQGGQYQGGQYQGGQYQGSQPQGNPYQGGQYQQPLSAQPTGPVTLNSGMLLPIRTSEPLDSKKVKPGDYFQGTVAQSIYVGNVIAIPRGAEVTGRIVDVKKAGELKGGASIQLQLTSLNLGGNSYPLATDVFNTNSPGKGGYTAGTTVGTAALGAVIGAIAGGGPGAAIGAAAGTGVGLGASAATPGPRSAVPPEALISFHLTSPATVQPVSAQDAAGMEASSAPPQGRYPQQGAYAYGGGPVAYPAPYPAYGYAPGPYAYGYGYPYGYRYAYGRYPYYGRGYYGRWR